MYIDDTRSDLRDDSDYDGDYRYTGPTTVFLAIRVIYHKYVLQEILY